MSRASRREFSRRRPGVPRSCGTLHCLYRRHQSNIFRPLKQICASRAARIPVSCIYACRRPDFVLIMCSIFITCLRAGGAYGEWERSAGGGHAGSAGERDRHSATRNRQRPVRPSRIIRNASTSRASTSSVRVAGSYKRAAMGRERPEHRGRMDRIDCRSGIDRLNPHGGC